MNYQATLEFAKQIDQQDPLKHLQDKFHIPKQKNGQNELYFCGNSLGLQAKNTQAYLLAELEKWQKLGVKGHFSGDFPWMPYHEFLTEQSANLVGAKISEVVMMNSLTVNLHLMMATFYKPTTERYIILIEQHAFPSDHFAVESQIRHHNLVPDTAMMLIETNLQDELLHHDEIIRLAS